MNERIKQRLKTISSNNLFDLTLLIHQELTSRWELQEDNISEAIKMLEEYWEL